MTKNKMANRYSPEVPAGAVRMVFERPSSYEKQANAIAAIAPKIGCIPQTLSGWLKQADKDRSLGDGVTTELRDHIKVLERENRELHQANEMLRKASAFLPARSSLLAVAAAQWDGSRSPTQAMIGSIGDQRAICGVESICGVLPTTPSTCDHRLACLADPSKASARHQRETELRPEIKRVWEEWKSVTSKAALAPVRASRPFVLCGWLPFCKSHFG